MAETETPDHREATEHLALVRALSHEISSAISAIERNDMGDFASRVAAQEAISHQLNRKGEESLKLACESYKAAAESPAGSPLSQKIREAHVALARLNRVYAALIRRSQKSIGLIISLYKSQGQSYTKDAKAQSSQHTWSCEV
ncbi:MAG: hypothetical protein WA172_08980 [Terriglobales bacterium]